MRKLAGFLFEGTAPEFTGYSLLLQLKEPHRLQPGRHHTDAGVYNHNPPGTVALVDFNGGASHRVAPLTREHVESVLRRVTGMSVAVESVESAATWTDRAYLATEYRRSRVLLAGDAAHVHSPLGGQGLNLGLGDAMNLGWKLAATVRRGGSTALLDTYGYERQPVAARVLDWSRAQVALMRPTAASRALAAVVKDLIQTRDGATYVAERVWGMSLRYGDDGTDRWIGRSAPDFRFADGTRLNEHLRSGVGVLLNFETNAALAELAQRWPDRLRHLACDVEDRLGLRAAFVRPDGVVAWVCRDTAALPDEAAGAARALADWLG